MIATQTLPTTHIASLDTIAQRTIQRRAVESVIWGMPAVNYDRMYQAMVHDAKAGEGSNKIVYRSRLFDWKNQTLTPNPDSIYLMPFYNTKDVGPVVLEILPPMKVRSPDRLTTAGRPQSRRVGPAGVDKGKGGKYLILPPGYERRCQAATSLCSRPITRAMPSCVHPQKQQL